MSITSTLTRSVAVSAVLLTASLSSAYALPAFTFNPAGAGLGTAPSNSPFTADNMIVQDFSTVTFASTPNTATASPFTDTGFLYVQTFQLANTNLVQPSLDTAGGFGFYFQFNATGVQNAIGSNGTATGRFTGVNFNFYGYNQGATAPTFSVDGTTATGVGTPTLLATGAITGGQVNVDYTGPTPLPSAFPLGTLSPAAGEAGFFQSPTPFYNILQAAFTNTASVVTSTATGFTINGGGGNATFASSPVPEPTTLALFATGLLGLGFMRRRRRSS